MMMTFGIIASAWLLVGFLTGLKAVYVNKLLSEVSLRNFRRKHGVDNELAFEIATNKKCFIAVSTLLGFIALLLDLKRMFKGGKTI
jgi:hypothetical protein